MNRELQALCSALVSKLEAEVQRRVMALLRGVKRALGGER